MGSHLRKFSYHLYLI